MAVIAPIVTVCGFFTGFLMAFLNGPTEICHAIISTKLVSPFGAFLMATVFLLVGPLLLGANVGQTVTAGIFHLRPIDEHWPTATTTLDLFRLGYLSVLIASLIVVVALNLLEIPVSPCHYVVAAAVGFSLVSAQEVEHAINIEVFVRILIYWLLTPVLSGVLSGIVYSVIRRTVLSSNDAKSYRRNIIIVLPTLCAIPAGMIAFFIVYHNASGNSLLFYYVISLKLVSPFPWWGALVACLGVAIITYTVLGLVLIKKGLLTKHHHHHHHHSSILKPVRTDTNLAKVETAARQLVEAHQLRRPLSISAKLKQHFHHEDPTRAEARKIQPTVRYSVSPIDQPTTSNRASRCSDCSTNKNNKNNVIVPFVDHQLSVEYFLVPADFTEFDVLDSSNEMYFSDYPRLITPRSPVTDSPDTFRFNFSSSTAISAKGKIASTRKQELGVEEQKRHSSASTTHGLGMRRGSFSYRRQGNSLPPQVTSLKPPHHLLVKAGEVLESNSRQKPFSYALLLIACLSFVLKSSNEVNNCMGPVSAIHSLYVRNQISVQQLPVWWVALLGGFGNVAGLWIVGRRLEYERRRHDGSARHDPKTASPIAHFCIHYGAMLTVLAATQAGMPVSMLHCELFSIAFVALCRSHDHVDWRTLTKIAVSWIPSMLASALLSAGLITLLREMFNIKAYINPMTNNNVRNNL